VTGDNRLLYGLTTCLDLHNILIYEGNTLENNWNEYNSFNFIVTAWHLYDDWLKSDWENRPKLSTKKKGQHKTPPNMMKVVFALRDVTNSSKHFFLNDESYNKKVVTGIHPPIVGDAASYFLHGPMIYIEIDNSIYSMWDLRHIVLLYFDWIFDDSVPAQNFPIEIQEHLERCIVRRN
jgi:hypothetical protein